MSTSELFTKSLVADFSKLLVNANDYNVLIRVGGGESPNITCIKAHSCILRARSPYFYSALSTKWRKLELDDNGKNCMIFEKPNISPDVFQMILSYIYSGAITLENQPPTFILDILSGANELMLQELESFVINHFIKYHGNWIKDNPIQLMHHAVFQLESCQNIQQLCLNNVCKNPYQLFGSLTFKSIHESILVQIIKRDDLRMNEINLLDYLIQWGINNTPSLNTISDTGFLNDVYSSNYSNWSKNEFNVLESTLKNCLDYIRFDNINQNELLLNQRLKHFKSFLEKYFEKCFIEENLIDSKIININHATLISDWMDNIDSPPKSKQIYRRSPSHKFKLILRGSRDDFTAKTFHRLCDNKGATVVVMKDSITGEIIGGYNPFSWTGGFFGYWIETDKSFIFQLLSSPKDFSEDSKLSRIDPKNSSMAIFCADVRGPCFGGKDLCMSNMNRLNKDCSTKYTYYKSNIFKSKKFDVVDYEVFQVVRKNAKKN